MTNPLRLITTFGPLADDETATAATTPEGLVVIARRRQHQTLHACRFAGDGWSELPPISLGVGADGPFAYHDGEQLVVGQVVGRELALLRGGRTHSLPVELPRGRTTAVHDPARNRAILASGGACFAIDGDRVVTLPRRGEDVALSVGAGRVIAVGEQTVAELDGERWRELSPLPARRLSTVAFDPERGAHLTLAKASKGMELFALEGDTFVSVTRLFQAAFDRGALLGWDRVKGAMVVHGGRDSSNVASRRTFLLTEKNKLRSSGAYHLEYTDGPRTALTVEDRLLVVDHERRNVRSLTGASFDLRSLWLTRHIDVTERFGNQCIAVAAGVDARGHAVFVVDALGGVWRLADGASMELPDEQAEPLALAPRPEVSPGRRGGCSLAWDEVGARLVMHGGDGRGDTWVFATAGQEAGAWRRLDTAQPPAETAALAGTPRGVFALVGGKLFRLDGDHWRPSQPVPQEPPRSRTTWMFHDRKRDGLVVVRGNTDGGELLVWSRQGLTRVAALPVPIQRLLWNDNCIGLDPTQDRILMLLDASLYEIPLSILGDAPIGLPDDAADPAMPTARTPDAWVRRAERIVPTETRAPVSDLAIPVGYTLACVLPASPALPLGTHGCLAVAIAEDLWERDPGDPCSTAFFLALGDSRPDSPFVQHGGRLVRATLSGFQDQHPAHTHEMATGADFDVADKSKIGGFACLLQGTKLEAEEADRLPAGCSACGGDLQFRAQLSADVFDLGESRVFVYVCDRGCEARATAEAG